MSAVLNSLPNIGTKDAVDFSEFDKPIPRSVISKREGGGGSTLDYLEGHYVISRLNKVFGNLNWSKEVNVIEKEKEITKDRYDKDCYNYTVVVKVKLFIQINAIYTFKEDIGSCSGTSRKSFGDALELAYKGAVTDALKRCAKDLGMSFGLALYDKEQTNVVEDDEISDKKIVTEVINKDYFFKDGKLDESKANAYAKYVKLYIQGILTLADGTKTSVTEALMFLKAKFNFYKQKHKVESLDLQELVILADYVMLSYVSRPIYKNEVEA